jgi:putative iron-regulated protein
MLRKLSLLMLAVTLVAACGDDDNNASESEPATATTVAASTDELKSQAVAHYADGVHRTYEATLASATAMDEAIDAFIADPTADTLKAAKDAWLAARPDYGISEAFRFYEGPIDNEEDGPEGLINAWPMDEAYVDYVEDDANAGVINDPQTYPTLDAELITSLNEKDGEANISTGWHAIEFLLWGQDLSEDGAGERPVTDYTTGTNAERRKTYLATTSDLLLEHLGDMVGAWAPDTEGNFRATFVALPADDALTKLITGIGELSRGELAGERMSVAYEERSQEDEHSCFSDNTTEDIIANATGIQNVLTGAFPETADGTGLDDLVASVDPALAEKLRTEVNTSIENAKAIPAPFDQHLRDGVPDDDPGRASILTTMESLEDQTDTIVAAATALGLTIEVT